MTISITREVEWELRSIDKLREAFPDETAGLTDLEAAKDAWANGVREPHFFVVDDYEQWDGR